MGFLTNALNWVGDNLFGIGQTAAQVGAQVQTNAVNQQIADANMQYQREANAQNIALTREQNALNRAMTDKINSQNIAFQQNENALTRAREDNAVQRRAIDLQKAGLSKTLSAGSPASASPLTSPQVQGMQYDRATVQAINNQRKYESALMKLNLIDAFQNIEFKKQELAVAQQKADNESVVAKSEAAKNYASVDNLGSSTRYNTALAELTEKKTPYEIQQLQTDIRYSIWQINNAMADNRIKSETLKKVIAETGYTLAQTHHLSRQDELLLEQIITEQLTQEKLKLDNENTKWDFDWYHGQRIPVGSLGHIGKDASLITGNIGNFFNGITFGLYDKLNSILSNIKIF